jgi:hypothetical protein
MNQGRAAAEAAQAQQYAQGRYQRALEAQRQGAQKRTANRLEEAAQAFIEAGALFGESLKEAQRTRVKQAAEAEKEAALTAQQQAHAGADLFPERFAEAFPSPRRKRAVLAVGVSGLALIAVLGGLYLVLHKTPPETSPNTMPPPATAPPPDTVPPGVDTRPVIAWSLPDLEGLIPLTEGHAQTFIIQAESPQGSPLHYVWFLDGEKQADGEQWAYQPDFTEASATPKEVKVVVTGEDGRTVERTW